MIPVVAVNISRAGFYHIVQKEGWLRNGISWNKSNVSDLSELLSWLCLLYGSVLSKDLSFIFPIRVLRIQYNRNGWGEGLILCFSLSGSAMRSKINATPMLGTILRIWQWPWFFVRWNWIFNHRFRFTWYTAPLTAEDNLRPANL